MKILKIQALRGPNVWSNYRKKLIQMRLDLEEMENYPTDKVDGFNEKLKDLLPGLIEHECSEGIRGGFFIRLDMGTWMGHVIEHVALEIQRQAGMKTGYGRTRSTNIPGVYNVVFSYTEEEAGIYAAKAAFRIVDALIKNEPYDVAPDIEALQQIKTSYGLGPSTKSIVEEAGRRGIPWQRSSSNSAIQLGYGINQVQFQATITCNTSAMGVDRACNKVATKQLLAKARIPVARGGVCRNEEEMLEIINTINYPVVIKPLDANQGKGATINVTDWETATTALALAKKYTNNVIVEKFIQGFDFRMLVIDHKFVAAAKRIPAHVIGDGVSSIEKLIEQVNNDPARGKGHENILTQIRIDRDTEMLLEKLQYDLSTVPVANELVYLKSTANLSTGGTAIDVTDEVHPDNIYLAERISRIIGLDICGIDIMADSLAEPIKQNGGVVLEVNAAPGFRMHLAPSEGQPRNVAAAVVDMLYPEGKPSRIPIIAITGTNGKTTTTRILAHIATKRGFNVGFTTTDGIYIGNELIEEGDTTGPISGNVILNDPMVDFAVLETARGGIIRAGLCFNECDVAIITNIKEDHLGLNDVHTLEDLANVKAVVARSVRKNGWAVLNADDAQCLKIAKELNCNIAYFSMDENNPIIQKQMQLGMPTAVYENGFITLQKGFLKNRIDTAANIPLTLDAKCTFMIANALAASLAAYVWGFSCGEIWNALRAFTPGIAQTPGRVNVFEFNKFKIIVDYAHNPHGYKAIEEYLQNVDAYKKIGIISGIGDRRDEDIKECATIAARMFDHIIIRQDHNLRGSSDTRINGLIMEGITNTDKNVTYEIIPDEADAIKRAISIASEGDIVVALSELYRNVVRVVQQEQEKQQLQHAV